MHTPSTVPVHWEKKVKEGIDRDVDLGVLEWVPLNDPVTYCHRMVLIRKHNGDPRRTVDLQVLNDHSLRQTHHTQPIFQQAMSIPHHMYKGITDAWHGYHSVAIREEDRSLTTFITPWGRLRYRTTPQGYKSAGDAYTHRFDKITVGVQNIKRNVDDSLLYESNIKDAFEATAKYLTLIGNNGILQNPDKFVFAKKVVDWSGLRIGENTVQPLPEHTAAIRNYPLLQHVTGY